MNRLAIIGNGFDQAHGLHTSYKDFIDWYLFRLLSTLFENENFLHSDYLISIERERRYNTKTGKLVAGTDLWNTNKQHKENWEIIDIIAQDKLVTIKKTPLLERMLKNIENKGWTDIESDYYELLKVNANDIDTCANLNSQMDFLKEKLAEYLSTQKTTTPLQGLLPPEDDFIDKEDVAQSSKQIISDYKQSRPSPEERLDIGRGQYKVEETMLLNFNYTPTAEIYKGQNSRVNYIHGSLTKPEEMIFGYGDEMDKDFKDLENRNENELLKNSKSVKYLETSHYRDLLGFIEGGPFQVYIMGHSCGNSDRTLLNTIFEHQNCISIKPFCYINEKGEDNYSELTRNIYRNFTDKKLFRDRVVNKERCTTLNGHPLINK